MKKHIYLYTAVLGLAFVACERDTKVNIPPHTPRLVLNGIIPENGLFEVRAGKSQGILTPNASSQYTVNNAVIVLFENGVAADTLKYDATKFLYTTRTNKRAQLGKTYQLAATAPGFTTAAANSIMPSKPVITRVVFTPNARTTTEGTPLDDLTITFNDPGGEKNYCLIQVMVAFGNNFYFPVNCFFSNDIDIERPPTDDPLSSNSCLNRELLLRDVNFNGRSKQLRISFHAGSAAPYIDPGSGRVFRPYVELQHITEDQFKFLKSRDAYDFAADNPFAEPVLVYSNVKNGYGIFAVHSRAVDSIR